MRKVIAVDGPGGSGKSSVSRGVAERLGWTHLDTGAFYRAATLIVMDRDVDPEDDAGVVGALRGPRVEYVGTTTLIDGVDVSEAIRTDRVTGAVSAVSSHATVRRWMVRLQRLWVSAGTGSVVEGRDIGTVVFPNAALKLFLTADPAERARRRAGQSGSEAAAVEAALHRRDRLDSTRAASPLHQAEDALGIDTTDMTLAAVIDTVVEHARIRRLAD